MSKTIMQVLPSLKQGGVEVGTIEIASALQAAGMPNMVVSSGGEMVARLQKIGVPHITLPVHTKNPFKIPNVSTFSTCASMPTIIMNMYAWARQRQIRCSSTANC